MEHTATQREEAPATPGGGQVLVYETPEGDVRVDMRLEQETVWLTQRQMADLFGRDRSVVARHISNAFEEGERTVSMGVEHYNLDVIISVGYRVKSLRGTQFRQWATGTLREHLVRGYTLNRRRLAERGLDEVRQTLNLLTRTLRSQAQLDDTGQAVLDLVSLYADTWHLLLQYDEDRLEPPPDAQPSTSAIDVDQALGAIATLKRDLAARGEATSLFGHLHGDRLAGILGSIEQTMFGESLYRSREEKDSHLLYFVVKDHPFTDGNKRIGALLFLLYLAQERTPHRLDPRALTALTLLIAESTPANKDLMVRLVMNLLVPPASCYTELP